MRRALCLLTLSLLVTFAYARGSQDFTSRFMQICNSDSSAMHCVTVSPKMIAQMLKMHTNHEEEDVKRIISKLKSARILTAGRHSENFYQMAERLLEKNNNRFRRDKAYRTAHSYGCFFLREHKGKVVELVMLQNNTAKDMFTAINLTGDLDDEFIRELATMWSSKTAYLKK